MCGEQRDPDQREGTQGLGRSGVVGRKREVFIEGNTVSAGLHHASRSWLIAHPGRPRTVKGMRNEHLQRQPLRIPVRTDLTTAEIDRLLACTCFDPDSSQAEAITEAIRDSPELASALAVLVEGGWTDLPSTASTRRANSKYWTTFERWCAVYKVGSLPATSLAVHRFLDKRPGTASAKTMSRYINAISRRHRADGHPDPTKHPLIGDLVEATQRLTGQESPRDPVSLADLHLLVDVVDSGGYWSRISDSSADRRLVKELLRLRWRALILVEWAGSLAARDSLLACVDDLVFDPTFKVRLAPTIERPDGTFVPIARFSNPKYDPVQAIAEWLEAAASLLPDCRHVFPTILPRTTPVVNCGSCIRIERSGYATSDPGSVEVSEEAVAEALRQDSVGFLRIAALAGLRSGGRMVTRDSLRLGAAAELARHGVSAEQRRRQKRTVRVVSSDQANPPGLERLAQIAQDLTRS